MSPKVKNEICTMAIAELVEDMDLYPRHAVDNSHVTALVLALKSGSQLPPIIADKKSKRITDGWHRVRAYRKMHGSDATCDVELIEYQNEADIIFDAVQRNAAHGRRLDAMDQTRSVIMMQVRDVGTPRIAMALHVTEQKVEKLSIKFAELDEDSDAAIPGTLKLALKRPMRHLDGMKLTKRQVEAHQMMPGTSFLLIAKQLNEALRVKLVNLEDEKLVEQLCALRETLDKTIARLC